MKANQFILTGLIALGSLVAHSAQAVTSDLVLRITGSTAFRSQTHSGIIAAYGGSQASGGITSYAYVGTSASGASQAIYYGTISGKLVIIKTSWSGSEAGVRTVAANSSSASANFLADTILDNTGSGVAALQTGTASVTAGTTAEIPDVAMADNYQSSSAFFGSYGGVTYPTLTEVTLTPSGDPVGIVAFQFVTSAASPITDITTDLAKSLFSTGALPLSFFTGDSTSTGYVFATGRDPDSGTRLDTLAVIGLGAQSAVKQYQPSTSATGGQVAAAGGSIAFNIPAPAGTVNGISVALYNNGYNSGGNLGKALANATTAMVTKDFPTTGTDTTGGYYVGYMSTGDASTAAGLSPAAIRLTFNGVPYTVANVLTGKYPFWSYEHMYIRSSMSVTGQAVAQTIANGINSAVTSGLTPSAMLVKRSTDGARILTK